MAKEENVYLDAWGENQDGLSLDANEALWGENKLGDTVLEEMWRRFAYIHRWLFLNAEIKYHYVGEERALSQADLEKSMKILDKSKSRGDIQHE